MFRFILSTALFFVLNLSASSTDVLTVLLLGDSTLLCKKAEEGTAYADWVDVFLSEALEMEVQVINGGAEGVTVAAGRKMLARYGGKEIDVIAARFGLNDALTLPPKEYITRYKAFIEEVQKEFPGGCLVLETSTPVDRRFSHYNNDRFKDADTFNAYLKEHFVAQVQSLAEEKQLPLVDQYGMITMALQHKKDVEAIIREDGVHLTGRGNLLAGQNTACTVLQATGMREVRTENFSRYIGTQGSIHSSKKEKKAGKKVKPAEPGLAPFLKLSERHVVPLLERKIQDPSPQVRIDALKILGEKNLFSERFVPFVVNLLKNPSHDVRKSTVEVLCSENLYSDRFLPLIADMLKEPGNRWQRDAQRWFITPAGTRGAATLLDMLGKEYDTPDVKKRVLYVLQSYKKRYQGKGINWRIPFTEEHYDALMNNLLFQGDHYVRDYSFQLLLENKQGIERFIENLKRYPEAKAVEIIKNGWEYFWEKGRTYNAGLIEDFVFHQIKDKKRPYLAHVCLEKVFSSRRSAPVPLKILTYTFIHKSGTLQRSALDKLLYRKEEVVAPLIKCLKLPNSKIRDSACLSLLELALRLEEDKAAGKALKAAEKYCTEDGQNDLLCALDAIFTGSIKCPARRVSRSRRTRSSRTSRYRPRAYSVKSLFPGRESLSASPSKNGRFFNTVYCQVRSGEGKIFPYFHRLRRTIPFLEQKKKQGTEEEKRIAERILFYLWEFAFISSKRKARSSYRVEKLSRLASHYKKEAEKNLRDGDLEKCAVNFRRALAADPSASTYNSFAWKLVSASDEARRDPVQAEKLARKAIERGGRKALYLDTLAASLAGQGQFKKALELQLEALQKVDNKVDRGDYAGRALLYLRKKTCKKK